MQSNSRSPDLTIVEQVGFVKILTYLFAHQNEQVSVKMIFNQKLANIQTVIRAMDFLEKASYIKTKEEDAFPFRHIITLTPKGLKTAQILTSLVDYLRVDEVQEGKSTHPSNQEHH